jgi:rhamnose utilization protein RhaD (predicted bifunctional aldolase and dehydrogenase)
MRDIFGGSAIWIPSTNPGYILAKLVKTAMDDYRAKYGKPVAIIFLQNHGVFVGDDSVDGVKARYGEIMSKISAMIHRKPDFSGETREGGGAAGEITRALAELAGGAAAFLCDREIAALVKDRASFAPVASAFTPDHIVYAGSDPLFTGAKTAAAVREAWQNHAQKTGRNPKIAAVQGLGVFGAAATEKASGLALELFRDAVKVAIYAESFGGPRFMTQDQIDFINNWEVERFRSSVSAK